MLSSLLLEPNGTTHTVLLVLLLIWFLRMLGSKKTSPPSLPPTPPTDPGGSVPGIPPYQPPPPPPVSSDPTPPPARQPKLTPEQQAQGWVFLDTAFPAVGRAARETISDYEYNQSQGIASLPGTYKTEFMDKTRTYEQQVWGPDYFRGMKPNELKEWFHTRVDDGKEAVRDLFGLK